MKFTLINYEDENEQEEMTISEIIENINRDRSDEWTNYDESDWVEGLLEFTEWTFILPKDLEMKLKDKTVIISHNILVKSFNEIITTDKGQFPISELKL